MAHTEQLPAEEAFKGFTNTDCPYFPCHPGVERAFNCLFCYCPLNAYECPGPYRVITDRHGLRRKDCSACTLPHDGYRESWAFIQRWLRRPVPWDGSEQTRLPAPAGLPQRPSFSTAHCRMGMAGR